MEEHPEYHFSKTLSGAIYPTGYVTAIIDLQKVGFDIKDIVLVTNDQAARIVNEYDQKHNLLKSLMSVLASLTSDEGDYYTFYANEVKKGHHILNVRASDDEHINRARDILKAHHAHVIKHFGRLTITNLP